MFGCSFAYAFTRIIGPLTITLILLVMRRRFHAGAMRLLQTVPTKYRFLVPPLAATAVFELTWSWAHSDTSQSSGILPQTIFPMVAGLFCFLGIQCTGAVQEQYDAILQRRDRLPRLIRLLIALAVPVLVAISITGDLSDEDKAYKEQSVTLLGLVVGYAALVPRKAAVRKAAQKKGSGLGPLIPEEEKLASRSKHASAAKSSPSKVREVTAPKEQGREAMRKKRRQADSPKRPGRLSNKHARQFSRIRKFLSQTLEG